MNNDCITLEHQRRSHEADRQQYELSRIPVEAPVEKPPEMAPGQRAFLYDYYKIKDEWSLCSASDCRRRTPRTFDGRCYTCHVTLFTNLQRPHCPAL